METHPLEQHPQLNPWNGGPGTEQCRCVWKCRKQNLQPPHSHVWGNNTPPINVCWIVIVSIFHTHTHQYSRWFEQTLQAAASANKQVIVSCHHPVGWGCCRPTHMAWNWKEVHEMMARAGCVRLVLHGHDHEGGCATVDGIHYLTMPGLVEGVCGCRMRDGAAHGRWSIGHITTTHSTIGWQRVCSC